MSVFCALMAGTPSQSAHTLVLCFLLRAPAGKLIYSLYGAKTESSFVKSWGVGLAMENATQARERTQRTLPPTSLVLRSHS